MWLEVHEIQSIEPDFYYKDEYVRCANSQIATRMLEKCQGKLVYCRNYERIPLPVSLEVQEKTVVSVWVIPVELDDDVIKQTFSAYRTVFRAYLVNSLIGKRLVHFHQLDKTVPPYLTINTFKIQTYTRPSELQWRRRIS